MTQQSHFEEMFRREVERLWSAISAHLEKMHLAPEVVQVVTKLASGRAAYSRTLGATSETIEAFEAHMLDFTTNPKPRTVLRGESGTPSVAMLWPDVNAESIPAQNVEKPDSAPPFSADFSTEVTEASVEDWMKAVGSRFPRYIHFVYQVPYTQGLGRDSDSAAVFVMLAGVPCRDMETQIKTELGTRSSQCLLAILFESWRDGLFPPSDAGAKFFKRYVLDERLSGLNLTGCLLLVGERGSGKSWIARALMAALLKDSKGDLSKIMLVADCSDEQRRNHVQAMLRARKFKALKGVVLEAVGQLSREGQENLRCILDARARGEKFPAFICTEAPVLHFRRARGEFDAALLLRLEYNKLCLPPFREWDFERADLWVQALVPERGSNCAAWWNSLAVEERKEIFELARGESAVDDLWSFRVVLIKHELEKRKGAAK